MYVYSTKASESLYKILCIQGVVVLKVTLLDLHRPCSGRHTSLKLGIYVIWTMGGKLQYQRKYFQFCPSGEKGEHDEQNHEFLLNQRTGSMCIQFECSAAVWRVSWSIAARWPVMLPFQVWLTKYEGTRRL